MPNFIVYRQQLGEGQWTVTAPSISVVGFGPSEEDAMMNLAKNIQKRFDLFMEGDDGEKAIDYSESDVLAIDLRVNVELTFPGARPKSRRHRRVNISDDVQAMREHMRRMGESFPGMDEHDRSRRGSRDERRDGNNDGKSRRGGIGRKIGRIDPELDMINPSDDDGDKKKPSKPSNPSTSSTPSKKESPAEGARADSNGKPGSRSEGKRPRKQTGHSDNAKGGRGDADSDRYDIPFGDKPKRHWSEAIDALDMSSFEASMKTSAIRSNPEHIERMNKIKRDIMAQIDEKIKNIKKNKKKSED